jgi:hypothetical protein
MHITSNSHFGRKSAGINVLKAGFGLLDCTEFAMHLPAIREAGFFDKSAFIIPD